MAKSSAELPLPHNIEKSPSGWSIIWREIFRDKLALTSLIFLALVFLGVFGTALFLNQQEIVKVDLFSLYKKPSAKFWLGTDYGGRDVFGQLIIGTRNSLSIGIMVTLMTGVIGITVGLVSGYFGGLIDNLFMRLVDFFMILPMLMMVIAFVTAVPKYNTLTFSLIMTAFLWMGIARLIRSKTLQEKELEYVQASRTLGSSHLKIIFKQVMPNLSSIIIVTMTLNLAANIGLESGLSFLGFGFPESTPSLGTLVSYARNPQTLQSRWWIWLPASLLILVLMLSINNVGQALKRATDARQRKG
ncbi:MULTISPECIES: ABC transporter permease [unclassified Paenibacillus]|uniref:ABC transporter permease n=1 Tax=unclassified Paenibacillus TaxID=185978 RepID=UPI002404F554|nr:MULTISPECIES: ABC transporter permease [unclassified Paenibacillus]MDF9843951.1 peptide/nickel transport system permease protein [Paenibacillus sp. PastF-2]MDF9850556.1 peptide/nickel transport system permease protein [Paenibacillus sp. PastM-2]MDF9856282.1 peptide/nickel transport system permease protein [Paenibacillus sp. PastF-1]MDH6481489.1 peptide/nickel transport system permease protein [Paenibacillus sp. PastH-2]MDH6509803.1 peptide/nickel transport system permease protein [Paenibaci